MFLAAEYDKVKHCFVTVNWNYFLAANKISEPVACSMAMKPGRGFGKFAI